MRAADNNQYFRTQVFDFSHQIEKLCRVPRIHGKPHYRLHTLSRSCLRARELLFLPLFEPLRNTLGMINKMHQLDVRLSGVFAKLMIISLEAARGHGGRGERVSEFLS